MGFTNNPEQCLEEAAGGLHTIGCAIYYKKCQEVGTVTSLILIGVPNTIEEDAIKQMLDNKLKRIKQSLLQNDKEYKLTREQLSNWIKYVVVKGSRWVCHGKGLRKRSRSKVRATQDLHKVSASICKGQQRLGQDMGQHNLYHQNTRGEGSNWS